MKKILSLLLAVVMIIGVTTFVNPVSAKAEEHEPVTITYMRQEARDPGAEQAIIEKFEQEYPWITVEIINTPAGDTYKKFLLADQAGEPIDVAWTFWTAGAAGNGLCADLSSFVTEEYLSQFSEAMLGIGMFEGKLYAIPWRAGGDIYLANVDVLEATGLDYKDIQQNGWTWDDFRSYAEQAREAGDNIYGVGFSGSTADTGTDWQFWPWLITAGGSVVKDNGQKAAFNSPEGVKALTFLCDLIKDDLVPPGVASTGTSVLQELQGADQLGMWQDGPWKLTTVRNSYPDKNFVALPLPSLDGRIGNISGGTALCMSAHSKHPEEAWLFLSYLTNPENMLEWCKYLNELSPIIANWDDPFYQTDDWQVCVKALRDSDEIFPTNSYYDNETLNQIMRDYLNAAYVGDLTPEEALAGAEEEWNAILDEYYGG